MVHGRTKEDCIEIAKKLSKEVGIENYDILFSLKEFKKSSMKYFIE
jgi:hypothetical protein